MNRILIMEKAAYDAGIFMRGAINDRAATMKTGAKDFVTVADIKSQDMIRKYLQAHYPNEIILSEEDTFEQQKVLYEAAFTGFIIDPIDGTYNFKRDMRESAISIGYIQNGVSIAGVIYDPYRQEVYKAEQGTGATRNDKPISVSQQADMRGASVATSNGYDDQAAVRNLQRQIGIYNISGVMPWTSCPGSAVLTMAWVACGRIDAFHHNGLKPWDNAAAFVICQGAGASITDLQGKKATYTNKTLLVAAPKIAVQLKSVFAKLPSELLV